MKGRKMWGIWLIAWSVLFSIGVLCEDLEEGTSPSPSYVVLAGEETTSTGEGETATEENALTKEEEEAKRRKNNQYFAAFVTLGAIGNSVSFYKLAKKMK